MKKEMQIFEWLMIGISQSPNILNENFYFDKRNNEFFSILITDYLMLENNLELANSITTSYSQRSQNEIVNRIKRIERKDENIISIPRLPNQERKELLMQFLKSVDSIEERERIERLYLNTDRTIFNREFAIESEDEIVEGWNNYKNKTLLSKAESFLNLNNININSARILEVEDEGSIMIDLTEEENGNDEESKWWKFWK